MNQIILNKEYTGFAEGTADMLDVLNKALTAGSGVDAAAFTGGRAMTLESLQMTMVNLLWSQEEAKLFKKLFHKPIKSAVHQWNKRTGVGARDGAWVAEGGSSQEHDQEIARKFATAKYLQTLRKATLQATLSNTVEDAVTSEKMAGTLWIIQQIEHALFEGNSTIITEEPDGLDYLIPSTHIIDLRGRPASHSSFETAMKNAAKIIRGYFGVPTDLLTSLAVMNDVQDLLKDRVRFPAGQTEGAAIFDKYPTPFGKPNLAEDVFIQEGAIPTASTITASRPSQVSIALTRQTASGGRTSKFTAQDAGAYYYTVYAINKYGASVASAAVQVTSVVAGDEIKIDITDGGTAGTGYIVCRSKLDASDGTDCRQMFRIARSGANPTIYDVNDDLPGCSSSYLLNLNTTYDAIEWAQFLPLMKFDLYPTDAAVIPFLMLLFGMLCLKKPEHHVRIKNIAPSDLDWFTFA